MEELFITKTKNGYVATDRLGRSAKGITKEIAKNNYFLTYGIDRSPKKYGYDMSNIEKKL